jgi:hypothetical protein
MNAETIKQCLVLNFKPLTRFDAMLLLGVLRHTTRIAPKTIVQSHTNRSRFYYRSRRQKMSQRPLSFGDGPLIWVDCEMTGLDPDKDKILEIAVSWSHSYMVLCPDGDRFSSPMGTLSWSMKVSRVGPFQVGN